MKRKYSHVLTALVSRNLCGLLMALVILISGFNAAPMLSRISYSSLPSKVMAAEITDSQTIPAVTLNKSMASKASRKKAMTAYKKFLKKYVSKKKYYFALCDITSNGIPALLVSGYRNDGSLIKELKNTAISANVYMYLNGKVKKVSDVTCTSSGAALLTKGKQLVFYTHHTKTMVQIKAKKLTGTYYEAKYDTSGNVTYYQYNYKNGVEGTGTVISAKKGESMIYDNKGEKAIRFKANTTSNLKKYIK
ncbi:MAG: hypothetical protein Q4B70_10590 [Lachnospiraceae bacterium]|nr:hypothetical protein [Lachnospiraceae bacterium]